MNDLAMACAAGALIGIVLFFVLALTGHIDRWTEYLVRLSGRDRE